MGEHGPDDLPRVVGRGVAPVVAEGADDVQPAPGLREAAGGLGHRDRLARVGDRAEHPWPGAVEADPDRRPARASPTARRACRSALVTISDTTIVMSSQRRTRPHRRRVATVNSRAAQTGPPSAPGARMVISGRQAQPLGAGSGNSRQSPPASPAMAAARVACAWIIRADPGLTGGRALDGGCRGRSSRRRGHGMVAPRGRPRGHHDRCGPVPRHDRPGRPETGRGLLASRTRQPAERIDTPAGADRPGTDVRLAER